ncbi:MAG TPA: TetR/AcrR family transcriptional regulator [Saprospiraceae bacterium]|nr:TetR/AcrR family transcriptional regulator [Saprospiraceae bacterium]
MYLCGMNATDTRERILQSMFTDIRRNGFQGLRADKVVAEMGITKGALYHYFDSKQSIGKAVIDEIIKPNYLHFYHELNRSEGNPIPMLADHLKYLSDMATDEDIALGCPLNNLIQEMSPLDEDFRLRMRNIVEAIQESVAGALQRGKAGGFIREDVDCKAVSRFFFSTIEGSYSMAKVSKQKEAFVTNMGLLTAYLESLAVS